MNEQGSAKYAESAGAPTTITLRAPDGCGPFTRLGRLYQASPEGIVEVPFGLHQDLLAHGFALIVQNAHAGAEEPNGQSRKRRVKHGGG
jgi:hypothetical protein